MRTRKHDPSLAVAYLRRSKEKRDGSTLGLEAQRVMCEAYAQRNGLTLLATHVDDDVSGATPLESRPALLDALSDIRDHGAGVLLVAKRDRLARDLSGGTIALIHREVARLGAIVVSADGQGNGSAPSDLLMRNMLDAFAEHERAMIRARTSAALRRKLARGEPAGGQPAYGSRAVDGRLVTDERERQVVATVRELHAIGRNPAEIARALAEAGYRNRVGGEIHRKQVSRILSQSAVTPNSLP